MVMRIPFLLLVVSLAVRPVLYGQEFLGPYTGYTVNGKAITIHAAPSAITFVFYQSDIVRADFLPDSASHGDSSLVIIRDTTAQVPIAISETDSALIIASTGITITCRKYPLRIAYASGTGTPLLSDAPGGGFGTNGESRGVAFTLDPAEHLYGTGERGTGIDRRGLAFDSYNVQSYGYSGPLSSMSITVPFLASTRGYALYFENTWHGHFDIGASNPSVFDYYVDGGELGYVLFASPSIAGLLERYTWLTGRAPIPPRWAFGYIQSKFGYQNETEVRSTIATMRTKRIPCDAVVLDLYWFRFMGDLAWNAASWPSPFTMMSDLYAQGIKTVVITEPYIIESSPNYNIAAANNHFGRTASGSPYTLHNWWSCGCNAGLIDMTSASARAWWWSLHPSFMGNHVAGIWTDLGEPERHPSDMIHDLGPAPAIHNIYNLLWAKTVSDGFAQVWPGRRVFNLTRSGYAGIQRYGTVTWSGDVARSFGGLAVQPGIMLGMGLSGIAYHNSDIGGFCCGTTTAELYTRWMQFGAFSPIMRAHGTGQPTEPWGFGTTTENNVRTIIELRYRLLPYTYTLAHQNFTTGMPLARPLLLADASDPGLANLSNSYLWGDALLVSPVLEEGQRTQHVVMPEGEWIDFWTGSSYAGGRTVTVDAPLDRIPLFVRSGSIIPMSPIMQHTGEHPVDTLILACYPGPGRDGGFRLYEDDGNTLDYQIGIAAETEFHQQMVPGDSGWSLLLSIGAVAGSYAGMPARRTYLSEIHRVHSGPWRVTRDGRPLTRRVSLDDLRQHGDGFFYDTTASQLFIHSPSVPDSAIMLAVEGIDVEPPNTVHLDLPLREGWNLISCPAGMTNDSARAIFPTAISQAFDYGGGTGYRVQKHLTRERGYWMKFGTGGTVTVSGSARATDTIDVAAGWNLIGSVTVPLPAGALTTIPPGIVTSSFYRFGPGGYQAAETIEPGSGYWVRTTRAGRLVLAAPTR
jgi:alpha-glucosidase (family GH31 glycosyl hydrolase)